MFTHLYELVCHRANQFPDAIAIGGQQGLGWKTLTSQEMLGLVDRLADELASRGVGEGDRVVLWVPNHWRTPVYLFALWKLGAIVVPFDREMNPEAAPGILDSVEPRLVLVGYDERPRWIDKRTVVEWWEPRSGDAGTRGHEEIGASGVGGGEGLAAIFFTSGTTGNPKGCMITHANLCSQVDALRDNIPADTSCRVASILPLSHLFELSCGLLYPLSVGAAIHYVPSRRGTDVVRVLSEQKITHIIAVPQLLTVMGRTLDSQLRSSLPTPVYQALNLLASRLSLPVRRKLFWMVHRRLGGHLQMVPCGGAALPAETHLLWERLGVRVVLGYGTSECSPVVACGSPDGSTPVGSVGRPLRGVEIRLGPDGELFVRGPNVMRGYWKDPERTAEVIRDGWYATGDLATIDESGNVRLVGRAKDLIVLPSGMNVWPQDVEDVLRSHPLVKDAAVIAVPSPSGGARLHAYLIPADPGNAGLEISAVVSHCNGRLAQQQRVSTASWWEGDFPRTSTLKVRRNLLPLPAVGEVTEVASVLAADDPVGQAIAGVARVSAVAPSQTLGEVGLDSLGLVELALRIEEKTGRTVADGDLRLEMTADQIRSLVAKAPDLADNDGTEEVGGAEAVSAEQPLWPYTWGRIFRAWNRPFDLLYRYGVTRTTVLGAEHLENLPPSIIFAGTHRSFADLPLVRHALSSTSARHFADRLVVAAGAGRFGAAGALGQFGVLAFGLYPLRQYGSRETSLRGLARLAAAGNAVLIFPQGHHTHAELEIAGDPAARFRPGVAHLTAALNAEVVPFGLAGTDRVLPPSPEGFKGLRIGGIPVTLNRGPLAIAFGAPLTLASGESPREFAARLEAVCFGLSRQAEASLDGKE